MPSLSPTHIPVRSYFPSDHFFILRKDHAMLLGEQAAQQTPGLESVRRIGVGVECSSVAPFAFLVLPTRAVANMGQREHKQQLFCFCFFKCGDVVGTHARPLTCAKPTCICAGTLRFQWAAWESGRLLRPVVFDAVCWDEETHKHFYVLEAQRSLFFFLCLQFVSLVPCITNVEEEEATYTRLMQSTGTCEAKWKQKGWITAGHL